MMDNHREAFKEEAHELLAELETALLELERMPSDEEIIGRVFRAMHTIKGSGAMFGFDRVAAFTHDVETVYDRVRNGKIFVTKSLIDLTLSACDEILKMIDDAGQSEDVGTTETITRSFRDMLLTPEILFSEDPGAISSVMDKSGPAAESGQEVTYRIRFSPKPGIFTSGTNPTLLLNEIRDLGSCDILANTDAIPFLSDVDPEACYTAWDIILTTTRDENAIRDVFIFVEDTCELNIAVIDDGSQADAEPDYKKLGEILVDRGDLNANALKTVLGDRKRIGSLLVDSGMVSHDQVQAALVEQQHIREKRQKRQTTESAGSIRVPAEKLDSLVNMVGELVTVQSRLNQLSARFYDLSLIQVAEEVERLTAELRDNTMSIRMLPIGATFSRFERLVRDLSAELGKEIVLYTEGAETELDKTVIEKLNDPLIHIIRNSIDHGIEKPDARKAAGKPAQGTVHLSAEHSGAYVFIRISDDGAGLDTEAIRVKAAEKGLIASDAALSEKEIFALTLMPGFSMAKTITNVSGRGVGMDVVKKGIDALQGTIEMVSKKGVGTTITLKLPLTMAIIDGLLVQIDDVHYIMPLAAIEECVELSREDVARAHGKNMASIRGEIVPYIRLRELFGHTGSPQTIEQIVTARIDGSRVGFVVDQVVGQHQTVIKSMSRMYRDIEHVSGATILGDGNVALILDLPKLTRHAEIMEKQTMSQLL
ncbi:MAG: chemotaxis protein CheA [Deltaproteobacteria bacterium]|nr:chemotaxis protein CheA [Deltaproteobacteria bacterium]